MKVVDTLLLFLLASIWGASFIFMRYLSPILGPILTTTVRTLAAGLFLTLIFTLARVPLGWKRNWKHYLVLGVLNSALPWLLFAWAALGLPGAVSSIVNAITPLWGAIFAALLLGEPIGARKLGGIGLGLAGVVVIGVFGKGLNSGGGLLLPILACVLATFLYGLFGAYVKRWAKDVAPRAITAGSLLVAGLALLPFAAFAPPRVAVVPGAVWLVALAFSLLCSALAYLIYYRLIASAGVTFALSVTLLIPVFALVWGLLFLGERIAPVALAGAALVLAGTWLITGSKHKPARAQA